MIICLGLLLVNYAQSCPAGMKFDAVLGPCIPERRKPVKMGCSEDGCDRRPVKMCECKSGNCEWGCVRARKALIVLQDD